ncbi:MAG TPA: MlaD family protein [Vicinamibacterales bacterium]|jgi:phospholipid/cholesterol/gamma-HCH transport system substrate-binding protein|nr:MlaD family protein [Vicinamibacterales bacterium]
MSTEARVGAFVVMCAAILGATVYSVGNVQFRGARVPYRTYLRYAGGLEPGTSVLFGGIAVGKVTAVAPDALDPTRIEIDLDVKQGTPVNAKSVAKLGSVSLMAGPVISITTGANDAPRLAPGAVIAPEETVSLDDVERKLAAIADTAQTLLASVGTHIDDITVDLRHLLSNLNDVTGTDNQRRVAAILKNVDSIVARAAPKVDLISDEVLKLTKDAGATLSNADGTITALREPIQADLGELRAALEQARNLIGSLQTVVRTNSDDINQVLENIRKATDNLNDFTGSVKERPWSLIRITQPKDRKVPQ